MKNQLGMQKIGRFRHHNDKLLRDKSQQNLKTIQKMGQFSSTSLKHQLQEEQTIKAILHDNQCLKEKVKKLEEQNAMLISDKSSFLLDDSQLIIDGKHQPDHHLKFNELECYLKRDTWTSSTSPDMEKNLMLKFINNLQSEINVLTKVRDMYKDKFEHQRKKNIAINSQINIFMEEREKCQEKLLQYIEENKNCEKEIAKLEIQLQEALKDIHNMLVNEKKKEDHATLTQHQLYAEIEKLKEKNEKYKLKLQQFKGERDHLTVELNNAWNEMRTVSFRKGMAKKVFN